MGIQPIRSGASIAGNLAPGFQGAGAHHFYHIGFLADRALDNVPGTQDQFFEGQTAILAKKFVNWHSYLPSKSPGDVGADISPLVGAAGPGNGVRGPQWFTLPGRRGICHAEIRQQPVWGFTCYYNGARLKNKVVGPEGPVGEGRG